LKIEKFVPNAKAIIIKIENVLIKAYYAIGKIERYYNFIKRAYEIIIEKFGIAISLSNAFQMAVKTVNDTAGPDGLVFIFLMFGAYFRLTL
jgi:hypothetical protein